MEVQNNLWDVFSLHNQEIVKASGYCLNHVQKIHSCFGFKIYNSKKKSLNMTYDLIILMFSHLAPNYTAPYNMVVPRAAAIHLQRQMTDQAPPLIMEVDPIHF